MHILIQQSLNHIEHKMFTAEDGESALVVEFDDLQSLEEWGENPDHRIAKASGKRYVFTSYDVAVREVVERHVKSDVRPEHLPSIAPSSATPTVRAGHSSEFPQEGQSWE
jgi:hypothetical protein